MSKAIQSLLGNSMVKDFALKFIKKAFAEDGLKMITIQMESNGELSFGQFNEPVEVVRTEALEALVMQNREAVKMVAELHTEIYNLKKPK